MHNINICIINKGGTISNTTVKHQTECYNLKSRLERTDNGKQKDIFIYTNGRTESAVTIATESYM